jgi:hypothetical protein
MKTRTRAFGLIVIAVFIAASLANLGFTKAPLLTSTPRSTRVLLTATPRPKYKTPTPGIAHSATPTAIATATEAYSDDFDLTTLISRFAQW